MKKHYVHNLTKRFVVHEGTEASCKQYVNNVRVLHNVTDKLIVSAIRSTEAAERAWAVRAEFAELECFMEDMGYDIEELDDEMKKELAKWF